MFLCPATDLFTGGFESFFLRSFPSLCLYWAEVALSSTSLVRTRMTSPQSCLFITMFISVTSAHKPTAQRWKRTPPPALLHHYNSAREEKKKLEVENTWCNSQDDPAGVGRNPWPQDQQYISINRSTDKCDESDWRLQRKQQKITRETLPLDEAAELWVLVTGRSKTGNLDLLIVFFFIYRTIKEWVKPYLHL